MNRTTWFVILCASAAIGVGACSSSSTGGTEASGDQGTGGSTTTTTTTTSSATTTSSTTTSSTTSSTSSGGGNLINGCDPATAEDHTADASTTVSFPMGGLNYAPRCIKIAVGKDVKFSGDFSSHPLAAGTAGSPPVPDPMSPIKGTSSGTTATFTFPTAGTFPYYCTFHQPGMAGVVFVE